MRCARCGTEVPAWAGSCPTCGTPSASEEDALPPPPEDEPDAGAAFQDPSAQWWSAPQAPPPSPGAPGPGWSGQQSGSGWTGQGSRSGGGLDSSGWSALAHLSAFAGMVVPFGNIVGPLVVWLVRRDVDPVSGEQARTALNFQISWTIWFAISAVLMLLLIGFLLLAVLGIAWLVLVVLGGVRASRGEAVRYPLTISFVQ